MTNKWVDSVDLMQLRSISSLETRRQFQHLLVIGVLRIWLSGFGECFIYYGDLNETRTTGD